jgi:hypothetical protein
VLIRGSNQRGWFAIWLNENHRIGRIMKIQDSMAIEDPLSVGINMEGLRSDSNLQCLQPPVRIVTRLHWFSLTPHTLELACVNPGTKASAEEEVTP